MATDAEREMQDLVAGVRALSAAFADPVPNIALNMELGEAAYVRGPWHAVFVATQIAALRLFQIEKSQRAQGLEPAAFPSERLLAGVAGRSKPRQACVAVLGEWVQTPPSREPIQQLVDAHGLLAFLQMVQVANLVGEMLVEVHPDFADLPDLLQKEALADELELGSSE